MASVHEQLSKEFCNWELRGRGWKVFDEPVPLEPPFVTFPDHHLSDDSAVDDGRRPTILSSLFRKPKMNLNRFRLFGTTWLNCRLPCRRISTSRRKHSSSFFPISPSAVNRLRSSWSDCKTVSRRSEE